MGWLWWVLVAVLLGGLAWWLMSRTKPDVYDAPGVGDSGSAGDSSRGPGGGAAAAAAGAVGAGGAAVLSRDEPSSVDTAPAPDAAPAAGDDPAVATAGAPDAAPAAEAPADAAGPSADLDPAAAGVAAPAETDAESAPEAVGAAPDEAGWAPAEPPVDAQVVTPSTAEGAESGAVGTTDASPAAAAAPATEPATADQAAAAADVEVPSDAPAGGADTAPASAAGWAPAEQGTTADAPAATETTRGSWAQDQSDVATGNEAPVVSEASGAAAADVAPAEDAGTAGQAPTDTSAEDPGHQVTGSFRGDAGSVDDGDAGAEASSAPGAWVQDPADLTDAEEAPVVSEASGAAAADVAPTEGTGTPGQAQLETDAAPVSGSTDLEFADASVATYEEPPADPSYRPTHLASEPTTTPASAEAVSAPDTSVDPAAAPQETPAPETGAGEGFGGAAIGGTAEASDGPYGPGSAEPLSDGSAPGAAYRVKGNVDSMRFHGPESPYYNRTTAEVWFTDADTARAAGFTSWNE